MSSVDFSQYQQNGFYDEMFDSDGTIRPAFRPLKESLDTMSTRRLTQLQYASDRAQRSIGMTFNVYSDDQGIERILPLDLIPRIISGKDWNLAERGLQQRIFALNQFLDDIYNEQKILKDKIIPEHLIRSCPSFLEQCIGVKPPKDIWCHIIGTDLIRDKDGEFRVLEDNLRCPSGVSYMLENREILKRTLPDVFEKLMVRPVADYALRLRETLEYLSDLPDPTIVVLTPGIYNSAYFEHSYLAQQMAVELVEGTDLVVENNFVCMRTTKGLEKVDVIYRRIDDDFLDPLNFRKDSVLGVPGLFDVYKSGNVALANAPGNGVADDKAVYAYVPDIIKYYLGEDIILKNIDTYLCSRDSDRKYVIDHIDELVVKQTDGSGGYGMLIGPHSTQEEQKDFVKRINANPHKYIAQPVINLSRVPTLIDGIPEGRHVDLRPYILYGSEVKIIPGALTRVALKRGSLVVNSSQGGGSKDTWVLYEENEGPPMSSMMQQQNIT
ncbi:MAG: circularly permuted type 2 ATP-grasp protein [Saprospiraceae bacterium]|nr:circularly permuted type 2 ATP-grasp protein [Saprospiraceae bacterium]